MPNPVGRTLSYLCRTSMYRRTAEQSDVTRAARIECFKALVGCPTPLGELSRIYVIQVCTTAPQCIQMLK